MPWIETEPFRYGPIYYFFHITWSGRAENLFVYVTLAVIYREQSCSQTSAMYCILLQAMSARFQETSVEHVQEGATHIIDTYNAFEDSVPMHWFWSTY